MCTDLEPMCEKNLQVPLDSLTNRAPRNRLPPAERHPSRSQPHVPAPSATRPPPPFRFFPLHPFGRRPAPSEDRTPERTATPSQQRGTQRRRSRRHRTRAGKRLLFWPQNRVLAQLRRNTLQKESSDLGFSELPDPDHPEDSRKPPPNVPERGFVAKIERSRRTGGSVSRRRRSRTIVEHPSKAPSRKNDSRPHPQACTPLASRRPSRFIGRYHVPQRKKPPGEHERICTEHFHCRNCTPPAKSPPKKRTDSKPRTSTTCKIEPTSRLRRIHWKSVSKPHRFRAGIALESQWGRIRAMQERADPPLETRHVRASFPCYHGHSGPAQRRCLKTE